MGEKKKEKKKIDRYREVNNNLSHRIKDSFSRIEHFKVRLIPFMLAPRGRRPGVTKLVLLSSFYLLFVENCLSYETILRTGSNPVDINGSKPLWKDK